MELVVLFLFALALSLDGFGVGLAYGFKKISVPPKSLAVICLTSATAISLSMGFGWALGSLFEPAFARQLGSVLMAGVGVWLLLQGLVEIRGSNLPQENITLVHFKVKPLGIAVEILKEPSQADFDRSGEIGLTEALVLGFALALDALGAGFGLAVSWGFSWLAPLMVGALKYILVSAGLTLGRRLNCRKPGIVSALLPGVILITLGLVSL